MVCLVSFGNTSNRGNNHEIALLFRRDEWSDKVKYLSTKHHLVSGDVTLEKVSCE